MTQSLLVQIVVEEEVERPRRYFGPTQAAYWTVHLVVGGQKHPIGIEAAPTPDAAIARFAKLLSRALSEVEEKKKA